jgi:hypothetical protein
MGAPTLKLQQEQKQQYDPNVLKYNEATKKYYFTNTDGVNIYISDADAANRNPTQYKALVPQVAQNEWTKIYEPQWQEYSADMQRQLQTAFDRSYADAQGTLGYGLSAQGSGEGGLYEASRMQLQSEASNKRADIAAQRDTMLQQAYIQFMQTKDQQAFEMAKLGAQYQYQKQITEMNDPSWWSTLGSVLGMAAGIIFAPATGGLSLIGTAASGANLGGTLTSNYAANPSAGVSGMGKNW